MFAVNQTSDLKDFWIVLTLLSLSRWPVHNMKRDTHWTLCCLMVHVYVPVKFAKNQIICLFYLASLALGLQLVLLHACPSFLFLLKTLLYTPDDCCDHSADEFTTLFDSTCIDVSDSVVPIRTKTLSEPWLNYTTQVLRFACGQAEIKVEERQGPSLLRNFTGLLI